MRIAYLLRVEDEGLHGLTDPMWRIIGDKVYYGLEFGLEEPQEFSTSYTSLMDSDRHFSPMQADQRTHVEARGIDGALPKKRRGRPRKHL